MAQALLDKWKRESELSHLLNNQLNNVSVVATKNMEISDGFETEPETSTSSERDTVEYVINLKQFKLRLSHVTGSHIMLSLTLVPTSTSCIPLISENLEYMLRTRTIDGFRFIARHNEKEGDESGDVILT